MPPYFPEYSSPTDTRNFDLVDEDEANNRHHYVRGVGKRVVKWEGLWGKEVEIAREEREVNSYEFWLEIWDFVGNTEIRKYSKSQS